jgi:2,4-diketo-3-deoxy-L-fuconate hydrolase
VLCIGQNYAAHAAESGDAPPSVSILFFKHPNRVVGAYDHVIIPPGATKVDWEAELAVVIGKRASYLASPEEALDYVAGYTVSNDVSERSNQVDHSGGQWSKGKCCATFNPLGPALVPNTGTPQGVALSGKFPYLREGDSMEILIEQLGRQEQKLVAFRR